ncbi:hypothetical protein YT1_p20085 (plasmid) [Rhodococcus ruber]|nr:hypothetical protein YT1_p20085 [Rhodococcus ruber]
MAGDRHLMCRGDWCDHGGYSMMRDDRCTRVEAVSETLGVLMQRSEAEAALLGAVLEVMRISDLALDAAVAGIPVLDVPCTRGIDICFSDKPDIL